MNRIVTSSLLAFIIFLSVSLPLSAKASQISVRPFLIDKTLAARDVVTDTIFIKNDYDSRKAVLFATVNEITVGKDGEIKEFISPVMTDRSVNVASWIEITRGRIEIPPHESKEVPVTIRINPFAKPGVYHAFIGIVEAKNRPAAEKIAMAGDAKGVLVKITVSDERENTLRIAAFLVNRFVTGENKRKIDIKVENLGDITSAPVGELIFYDSRGVEVASEPVNTNNIKVEPGKEKVISAAIPEELVNKIGRYKAKLALKYGDDQAALLYDTATFYSTPPRLLLTIFGIILLAAIILALWIRKRFFADEEDDYQEVPMYVRDGHEADPQDHDINLKN